MTFPDLPPGPWQDQEADLAAELEAVGEDRYVPSEEELAGAWTDRPAGCADWIGERDAGLDDGPGGAVPVLRAGFAEGGVLDRLGPGPALAGFAQGVLDEGLGGLSDDETSDAFSCQAAMACGVLVAGKAVFSS